MLNLPASKTDLYRKKVNITVAAADDDGCVFQSIKYFFIAFLLYLSTLLFNSGQLFTGKLVREELRKGFQALEINGPYAGHAFRRNRATEAIRTSISEVKTKLLDRWLSNAYELYQNNN